MTETRRCPQCGTAVRPDIPEGLCPECLLKQAIKSESGFGQEPGVTAAHAQSGQSLGHWHWVMLAVVGCIYVIALFLPAYRPYVEIARNNTFNVWSSFSVRAYVREPWLVNCVFWVACGFFAFRLWLLAALVAQAAVLFGFFALSGGYYELLVGHWIWLTSIELLAGCGCYEFVMRLTRRVGKQRGWDSN